MESKERFRYDWDAGRWKRWLYFDAFGYTLGGWCLPELPEPKRVRWWQWMRKPKRER